MDANSGGANNNADKDTNSNTAGRDANNSNGGRGANSASDANSAILAYSTIGASDAIYTSKPAR